MKVKNLSNETQCVSGFAAIAAGEVVDVTYEQAQRLLRNPSFAAFEAESEKAFEAVDEDKPNRGRRSSKKFN